MHPTSASNFLISPLLIGALSIALGISLGSRQDQAQRFLRVSDSKDLE